MFPFMKFMSWVLSAAVGMKDDEDDEKKKLEAFFLPHRKFSDKQHKKVFLFNWMNIIMCGYIQRILWESLKIHKLQANQKRKIL
jgi:hypothetical protein